MRANNNPRVTLDIDLQNSANQEYDASASSHTTASTVHSSSSSREDGRHSSQPLISPDGSSAMSVSVDTLDVYDEVSPGGTHRLNAYVLGKDDQRHVAQALEDVEQRTPILLHRHGGRPRKVKIHAHTVHYHEAPHYVQGNEFLVRGYRMELSWQQCLQSCFVANNEIPNIWSHFIGFLAFFSLFIWVWTPSFPIPVSVSTDPQHHILFGVFCLCVSLCCCNSTIYHIFCAMSQQMSFMLLQADYLGILAQIGGSVMLVLFYLFYCNPPFQILYLTLNGIATALGIFATTRKRFYENEARNLRASVFFLVAATSLVPAAHFFAIAPYHILFENGLDWPFYSMVLVYVLGITFFVSRIPERCCPGKFDLCLHSHSYMHCCTVIAAAFHLYGCIKLVTFIDDRDGMSCSKSWWD
eukprot:ANDGO_00292.mRNA.1 Adiponectin receptor protein